MGVYICLLTCFACDSLHRLLGLLVLGLAFGEVGELFHFLEKRLPGLVIANAGDELFAFVAHVS